MTRRLGWAALLLAATIALAPATVLGDAPPSPCPSGASADLCAQQQLLDDVRRQLDGNLASALQVQQQLTKSLEENAKQQAELKQRIADAGARIAELDGQVAAAQADMDRTSALIDAVQQQMAGLARAIYVQQPASPLLYLLAAENLRDLVTGTADLTVAGARAQALKAQLDDSYARLSADRAKLAAARDEQAAKRDQMAGDLQRLDELRAQQEASMQSLAVKIAETRAELAQIEQQSADLAKRIAAQLAASQQQIVAAAMQQAWEQALIWIKNNPGTAGALSPGHSTKYRFIWPQPQGPITQPFGPTDLAIEPTYDGYSHFHTGIDIGGPDGSPIYAADDGIVAAVGSGNAGYGNYVVLAHRDGLVTLYGHLTQAVVKVGDQVVQGQPVGLEGSTGNSTGPHLHFELRVNGQPVDPSPYLPPGGPSSTKE